VPDPFSVEHPQERQLLAGREDVLPHIFLQAAMADVEVLQLAAGCQGGVRCCWGIGLLTLQAATQSQVHQLRLVLQNRQQLQQRFGTITRPTPSRLQVLQLTTSKL
jgi:hypothetical protein